MEKNEIVINGVHHVLVDGWEENCKGCSLADECDSQNAKGAQLCDLLNGNGGDSHFEIKNMQEDIIDNVKELNPDISKEVDEHFDELI